MTERPGFGGLMTRRVMIGGAMAGIAAPALGVTAPGVTTAWATLDKATGRFSGVNVNDRMPMCSTFKWLLAACVLARTDRGLERLSHRISFGPGDLLGYAPTVRAALTAAGGDRASLSIKDLCEAAVTVSDNSAANLLLPVVGGPEGLTAWLRRAGDPITRLDRTEPALNRVPPGDPRDTTNAAAMLGTLDRLLFGAVLSRGSRHRLTDWLLACKTGADRLPAGLPAGWRAGHKTGTYTTDRPTQIDRNAAGDVGLLLPPSGKPILIAAYVAGSRQPQPVVDRWFAGLARDAVRRRIG